MLMRTDPFRELDRLSQQLLGSVGTTSRPAVMPMDAWRDGDEFVVEFDLPGVDANSVDLDVERNVLTVKAERPALNGDHELVAAERPRGVFSRQLFLGDNLDTEQVAGQLRRRRALAADPRCREGQAAQDHGHPGQGRTAGDRRLVGRFPPSATIGADRAALGTSCLRCRPRA